MNNYRLLWEKVNGPIFKDEKGRSYEIHHINGDHTDNDISNLKCVTIHSSEWQKNKAKQQIERGTHNLQVKWVYSSCGKEEKGSGAFSRFHGKNCKSLDHATGK